MKKFFMFLAVSGLMIVSAQFAAAQENDGAAPAATDTVEAVEATPVSSEPATQDKVHRRWCRLHGYNPCLLRIGSCTLH